MTVNILFLVASVVFFTGCAKDHVIYRSSASIEFVNKTRRSHLEIISLSDDDRPAISAIPSTRKYSVFYGIDDGHHEYIVFVPKEDGTPTVYATIEEHRYFLSVPFSKEQAIEFIGVLESSLDSWGQDIPVGSGDFLSYSLKPKYESLGTSDSLINYGTPLFDYHHAKSVNGNSFSLMVSDGSRLWRSTSTDQVHLRHLKELFQAAVDKMDN